MNSAAFCKGGKKGKVVELSHWSRGPSLSRARSAGRHEDRWGNRCHRQIPKASRRLLLSKCMRCPGRCVVLMCLPLCKEKSELYSTQSNSLSLSRSEGRAVSCQRPVKSKPWDCLQDDTSRCLRIS